MSALAKMEAIKSVSGMNKKKDILRTLEPHEKKLFELALDPAKIFWFQMEADELPRPVGEPGYSDSEATSMFYDIVEGFLMTRKATGNKAEEIVRNLFSQYTKRQQDILRKVLNKDLGIGVEAKTYLSIHKGAFPLFECMLAQGWEGEDVTGWYAEPKWDGLRAICMPDDKLNYAALSRNGKLLYGMDHILKPLEEIARRDNVPYVFDGEGCGPHWRDYAQARTKSLKESALHYYCFDLLTIDEWNDAAPMPILANRKKRLNIVLDVYQSHQWVTPAMHSVISPEFPVEMAMSNAVELGWEGIVIKNPGSSYEKKRSGNWLKKKPREPVDLVIVDAEMGTDGVAKDSLGALVVDYNGVRTKIGTGFSKNERDRMWLMHLEGTLVGKQVEVEKGPVTPDGKLFHASYLRLRLDK